MDDFQSVLSKLPKLSSTQLNSVIALASSLRFRTEPRVQRPRQKPKGVVKEKGPAQRQSPFSNEPEYQAFKASEKKLRLLLKEKQCSLKELRTRRLSRESALILASFDEARQCWFRAKTELKTRQSAGSSETEEKAKEEAE
jgi:hypothetical protein